MPGFLRLLPLLLLAGLAACGSGRDVPPLPPLESSAYKLGPGDQIRIITFGEDALSEIFRVNDGGNIALPLLGAVQARGLTTDELGTRIAGLLKSRNLMRNPSVSVEVTEYRPAYVLGEVNKPGQFFYQPGMTVLSAVAVAGGFTYRAVDSVVAINRVIDGKPVRGNAGPTTPIAPGDIITVYERYF